MKILTEEQKNNRKLWVKALRSGKFYQTACLLKRNIYLTNGIEMGYSSDGVDTGKIGYCCLGVYCEIKNLESSRVIEPQLYSDYFKFNFKVFGDDEMISNFLSPKARESLGLSENEMRILSRWNDDENKTFGEIADLIENGTIDITPISENSNA